MNQDLQNLEIKVENNGVTPQGRVSAAEWNIAVSALKDLDLGGGGGVADSVAWSNITGKPTWIGAEKPSYSYSEITDTPDLGGFVTAESLTELLSGKADKATKLAEYGITDAYTKDELNAEFEKYMLKDTAQSISAIHDFTKGLLIDGLAIKKSQDKTIYIDGNLVVSGAMTMFGKDSTTFPTIWANIPFNPDHMSWDGSQWSVVGGGGGNGDASDVANGLVLERLADLNSATVGRFFTSATGDASDSGNRPNKGWITGLTLGLDGQQTYARQLAFDASENVYFRRAHNGTWDSWHQFLTEENYNRYALPITGGTVSGDITLPHGYRMISPEGNIAGTRIFGNDTANYRTILGTATLNTLLIGNSTLKFWKGTVSKEYEIIDTSMSSISFPKYIATGIGTTSQSGYKVTGNGIDATFGANDTSGGPYIWVTSKHALRFATNGAERMRIIEDGNVAIGKETANSKLDVYTVSGWTGSFSNPKTNVAIASADGYGLAIHALTTTSEDKHLFRVWQGSLTGASGTGKELFSVQSGGYTNINCPLNALEGIFVGSANSDVASASLYMNRSSRNYIASPAGSKIAIHPDGISRIDSLGYLFDGVAFYPASNNGYSLGKEGYAWNKIYATTINCTIINGGLINLAGDLYLGRVLRSANATWLLGENASDGALVIGSDADAKERCLHNYNGKLRLTAEGGVEAQLTYLNSDPTLGTLDTKGVVRQVAGSYGWGLYSWLRNSGNGYIQVGSDSRYAASKAFDLILQVLGGNVAVGGTTASEKLHVYGNILATGAITMFSQASLKNVINHEGLSLDELAQIRPARFKWKDGRDERVHVGVIAENILPILPEVVYFTGEEKTKTVDYASLATHIGVSLIKPVVNLAERVKYLEAEVKTLKQENNKLKQLVA